MTEKQDTTDRQKRLTCASLDAVKIAGWLRDRGGVLVWDSIALSDPGVTWTTPAFDSQGGPIGRPSWKCGTAPIRHVTDPADVDVIIEKEVKRFHVAVRVGSNGLTLKVTDYGSKRIRKEVSIAEKKFGKDAWYAFDYGLYKNAIIMIEDSRVPLTDWLESRGLQ